MVLKSKIKWVAVVGLALSAISLATHFLLARFSAWDVAGAHTPAIQAVFAWTNSEVDPNYGKVWSRVSSLKNLRPYAVPKKASAGFKGVDNGYLFADIEGEFHEIRSSICDLVVVARLLNATLVLPRIQEVSFAKGISSKFKGFDYIYDGNHFIEALKGHVLVVKNLPKDFKAAKKQKAIFVKYPSFSSTLKFYLNKVLPALKSQGIVRLSISGGGCLQSLLPPDLIEYQRLRCWVAFEVLRFRKEIQELGFRMVRRLKALGQPYLAFHSGLERDALAFHGCAERFQDIHSELIQYKRALMIKDGLIKGNLSVDSETLWRNGSCPLLPEEFGVLIRALGYGPHTRIYISGAEIFGGQRVLIPLRAMFSNLEDRTTLTTEEERTMIYGPEEVLPPPSLLPHMSLVDDVKQRIAAWEVAGPRPRPLPPPPSRKKYIHEMEGWWAWVALSDKEPKLSLADLRHKGHKLLWAALDYIVCVESTAFFPGFDRDRNGQPNFASLVMGHRAYESPSLRTYRPDRRQIVKLFEDAGDKVYHPKWAWVVSLRDHLKATLGAVGLANSFLTLKPDLFLSHPLPECICRIPVRTGSLSKSVVIKDNMKDQTLLGKEDICPDWMENEMTAHTSSEIDEENEVDIAVSEEMGLLNAGVEVEEPVSVNLYKVEKEESQSEFEEDVETDE